MAKAGAEAGARLASQLRSSLVLRAPFPDLHIHSYNSRVHRMTAVLERLRLKQLLQVQLQTDS